MREPTTPTGKRLVAALGGVVRYPPYTRPDILAIEQEAACGWRTSEECLQALDDAMAAGAQQERERLRNVWDGWQEYGMPPDVQRAMDSGDTPHVVWRLLTGEEARGE